MTALEAATIVKQIMVDRFSSGANGSAGARLWYDPEIEIWGEAKAATHVPNPA